MAKNITTKTTIQNLTAEIKSTFAKKTALEEVRSLAASAFKSGLVEGSTVKLFTSADKTGDAAFSFDFPTEYFLDQTKSQFVQEFAWAEATYPGSTNPNLDGKPVMVLAIKGDNEGEENDTVTYSFVDLTYLLNTYEAAAGDGSTTVTIDGYKINVNVNVSADEGNILTKGTDGGLYVPTPEKVSTDDKADKVEGATEGNLAALDAEGNLVDSGVAGSDVQVKTAPAAAGNLAGLDADGKLTDSGVAASSVLTDADISDYTAEEIATMLADDTAE